MRLDFLRGPHLTAWLTGHTGGRVVGRGLGVVVVVVVVVVAGGGGWAGKLASNQARNCEYCACVRLGAGVVCIPHGSEDSREPGGAGSLGRPDWFPPALGELACGSRDCCGSREPGFVPGVQGSSAGSPPVTACPASPGAMWLTSADGGPALCAGSNSCDVAMTSVLWMA